ncbi:MAG: hypothetical protein ACREP6_13160 [Candidatus Binataceae bacterium]
MKLPDVYSDWRIIVGLALVLLGAGNWVVGLRRTEQYAQIIAKASDVAPDDVYRSFDELDPHTGRAVLEPFTAELSRVSYATARMDFYHATFLTGQALVLVGMIFILIGFIRVIHYDARRAARKIRIKALAAGAGRSRSP